MFSPVVCVCRVQVGNNTLNYESEVSEALAGSTRGWRILLHVQKGSLINLETLQNIAKIYKYICIYIFVD